MQIENLNFTAKVALIAAVGWALYRGIHLVRAIEELGLLLPMTRLLNEEFRNSLDVPNYGKRETLIKLAKTLVDSLFAISAKTNEDKSNS